MAKDGTSRGGARSGAGRKTKALSDKILEGRLVPSDVAPPTDLEAAEMPPVSEFMERSQNGGEKLLAKDIYTDLWRWLKTRGAEKAISKQLMEQYSMTVARWIQCENLISEYGFISKHPTTKAPIASPYVSMSRDYLKQITQLWYQIFQVVRETSGSPDGRMPQDDMMEKLLSGS